MSKNGKGYMGDQIGKLGPAVGARWKGKMVYRSYQQFVHDPSTKRQTLVRARFKQLAVMASAFLNALRIGLAKVAKRYQNTEGNNFMRLNWPAVTATSAEQVTVDYASLVISTGHLPQVDFGTPDFDTAGKVTVPIGGVVIEPAKTTDKVYLYVYQPDTGLGLLSEPALRSDSSVSIDVPSVWSGMRVHVYGFAAGAADEYEGELSPSTYVGTGDLA